jgi:hypothetical protein
MSDLTHACSVFIAGLLLAGLGVAMSWHCWRSVKTRSVQVSPAIVLEQRCQPVGFRFMVLFFGLCALVLLAAGAYCVMAAARLF